MVRKMKFIFIILFLLVLLPSIATATVTVSTDQSGADLPDVMAERTFTITASGWSGDCTSATLDLSECGVCSVSENETKSITGDSVSWTTLTGSKANSQKITVSVSGTCSPDSGYVTFNIKNPPSLSATVDPTSTSVTQGSTFSLSLNIQNNGETTATFGSITVSPSYFSISSGCSPSDISGGQSSGISCTIAASGSAPAGSRTLSILISPTNADSVTKTVSVTVNSAGSSTTTTASGSGGGPTGGGGTTTTTTTTTMTTVLGQVTTTVAPGVTTTIPVEEEGMIPILPEKLGEMPTWIIGVVIVIVVVVIILVWRFMPRKQISTVSELKLKPIIEQPTQ